MLRKKRGEKKMRGISRTRNEIVAKMHLIHLEWATGGLCVFSCRESRLSYFSVYSALGLKTDQLLCRNAILDVRIRQKFLLGFS